MHAKLTIIVRCRIVCLLDNYIRLAGRASHSLRCVPIEALRLAIPRLHDNLFISCLSHIVKASRTVNRLLSIPSVNAAEIHRLTRLLPIAFDHFTETWSILNLDSNEVHPAIDQLFGPGFFKLDVERTKYTWQDTLRTELLRERSLLEGIEEFRRFLFHLV